MIRYVTCHGINIIKNTVYRRRLEFQYDGKIYVCPYNEAASRYTQVEFRAEFTIKEGKIEEYEKLGTGYEQSCGG